MPSSLIPYCLSTKLQPLCLSPSMAQRSHVPKFGSWDKDNIPYTACFENARKEKSGLRMNPNDPEENPEAFMYGEGDVDFSSSTAEKHDIDGHRAYNAKRSNRPSDYRKSTSHRNNIASESGSDKSSSDNSLFHAGYQHQKSDRKTGLDAEGGRSFSTSRHSRNRSGSAIPSDDSHQRAASIPKFGAWDEADPKSGESFTVIFNRVKEEKQIASTTFPTVPPPQPKTYAHSQRNQVHSAFRSKFCCCFSSHE